jgi:hypothetical protein
VVEEGEGEVRVVVSLASSAHQRRKEVRIYRWLKVTWRRLSRGKRFSSSFLRAY